MLALAHFLPPGGGDQVIFGGGVAFDACAPVVRRSALDVRHVRLCCHVSPPDYKHTGSLAEVAELLGDSKRVAAEHYVYALTDYREAEYRVFLWSGVPAWCVPRCVPANDRSICRVVLYLHGPSRLAPPRSGLSRRHPSDVSAKLLERTVVERGDERARVPAVACDQQLAVFVSTDHDCDVRLRKVGWIWVVVDAVSAADVLLLRHNLP